MLHKGENFEHRVMKEDSSMPSRQLMWQGFVVTCLFLLVFGSIDYYTRSQRHSALKALKSILPSKILSLKIHDSPCSKDYQHAMDFRLKEELVTDLFQSFTDLRPYQREHDRALAQWGMKISADATIVRVGCHLPDHKPGIAACTIISDAGSGDFQSQLLFRWYQKYGNYWEVGGYQKVQYGRVKPTLSSLDAQHVTSFTLLQGFPKTTVTKNQETRLTQETALIAAFFEALKDMRFATPSQSNLLERWKVRINTNSTEVTVECSISENAPTLVLGLIESHIGYTYFQSHQLFDWYQTYSHRWSEPEVSE